MSDEGDEKLDRREFLRRAGLAGLMAVGAGRYATGCDKGGGSKSSGGSKKPGPSAGTQKKKSGGGAPKEKGGGDSKKGGGGEFSCDDTSKLKESEIQTRKSLKYVDQSDKPNKNCANCQLYQPPKSGNCGSCTTVPGPIHPDGYCTAWVKKKG